MNALEYTLPPELRFPKPPFPIDGRFVDATSDAVSGYLDAIRSWRSRVLEFLKDADGKCLEESHYLSARAQKELGTFLAESWTPGMSSHAAQSPYNMNAFPHDALEGNRNSRIESVLDMLRWRAGVVDYLGDAPFAMFPAIELDESAAMDQFLKPVDYRELCRLCLTEFERERNDPDAHDCLLLGHVRAKWPKMPAAFRSWAAEAKKKSP